MRGLSSRLTRVLVLTGLNRPWGHSIRICHEYQAPVLVATCWGPLMDWNLVVWSWPIRKQRREKEADTPWFRQKANKAPARGLLCSRRPQAPSQWGEVAERLLQRVLVAQAGKWTQKASALQGIYLKERERVKERKRKQDTGAKALMEQRCFNQHGVGIYTVVILSKDKD